MDSHALQKDNVLRREYGHYLSSDLIHLAEVSWNAGFFFFFNSYLYFPVFTRIVFLSASEKAGQEIWKAEMFQATEGFMII